MLSFLEWLGLGDYRTSVVVVVVVVVVGIEFTLSAIIITIAAAVASLMIPLLWEFWGDSIPHLASSGLLSQLLLCCFCYRYAVCGVVVWCVCGGTKEVFCNDENPLRFCELIRITCTSSYVCQYSHITNHCRRLSLSLNGGGEDMMVIGAEGYITCGGWVLLSSSLFWTERERDDNDNHPQKNKTPLIPF